MLQLQRHVLALDAVEARTCPVAADGAAGAWRQLVCEPAPATLLLLVLAALLQGIDGYRALQTSSRDEKRLSGKRKALDGPNETAWTVRSVDTLVLPKQARHDIGCITSLPVNSLDSPRLGPEAPPLRCSW